MKKIKHDDLFFLSLCFFVILLASSVFLWNSLHQHYYLDFQWIGGIQGNYIAGFFCALYFFIILMRPSSLLFTATLKSIAMLFISLDVMELANTAILTTPFVTHDLWIVHIDRLLGFHFLPILQLVHAHPAFHRFVWQCYLSLLLVMHVLPIALAVAQESNACERYFCSFLISIIIGFTLFYFFPTMTSPAAVYPHHYFNAFQLNTLRQFQLEHLHKIIDFNLVGGVISFPSYHAIWVALIVYFMWPYGWMRYVALIYGMIILATTILTGWHYLLDIIAGIVIAALSIGLSNAFMPAQKENRLHPE